MNIKFEQSNQVGQCLNCVSVVVYLAINGFVSVGIAYLDAVYGRTFQKNNISD